MKTFFAEHYTLKFSNLVKSSNPFYRFMRYCYGVDRILKKHEELIAKRSDTHHEGVSRTLFYAKKDLEAFSKKYNWLSRKLLGFTSLVKGYEQLHQQAKEQRCDLISKNIDNHPLNIKFEINKGSFDSIREHLKNQRSFIKKINAEVRQPNKMPHTIEIYGKNNQIHAYARVSGGKSMTYANLKMERDANIEKMRECLVEFEKLEKNRFYTYTTWNHDINGMAYPIYHSIPNPYYESNRQQVSNQYDGCDTTKSYVEDWMKELSMFAPRVEIDDKTNKPSVEYPYESQLFREMRNKKPYLKVSVWETEKEAKEGKRIGLSK